MLPAKKERVVDDDVVSTEEYRRSRRPSRQRSETYYCIDSSGVVLTAREVAEARKGNGQEPVKLDG